MDLPSLFATRVNLAGREVPLIAVGAGAGVVLALVVKLRGGSAKTSGTTTPTTGAEANYNLNAAIQTAQAQNAANLQSAIGGVTSQIQGIQAGVDTSLAGLRAQYLSDLTTQIGQVTTQTQAGLAGLQQQFSGNLAQVQSDVQSLRASTESQLQAQAVEVAKGQQATSGQIQALTTRVTNVENAQGRTNTGLFNLATWLGRWNIQLMNQLPPQQQQTAGRELSTNLTVPLQAFGGQYRSY